MEFLFQELEVKDFTEILAAYREAGIELGHAIDGGAGAGTTAEKIRQHLTKDAFVFAYEPFTGNHRFFVDCNPQIKLVKKALSDASSSMTLSVHAVVQGDSAWGKRGLEGYSSAGHLTDQAPKNEHDAVVECVRADEDLQGVGRIGFVKLDLQGGELSALKGMSDFLKTDVSMMWIEYMYAKHTTPKDIYNYLIDDFLILDTEYLFRGAPTDEALTYFKPSREGNLSSGASVWYGFKRRPWTNFLEESELFANSFGLIQTDLVAINKRYLGDFLKALGHIN